MKKVKEIKGPIMLLPELRQKWAQYWDVQPHTRIGRRMLEKSLEFKLQGARGGGLIW